MSKRNLIILFMFAVAVVMQACGVRPQPEESCSFVQNADAQRVSWGSSVPVIVYVDRSVPSEFFNSIKNAANEWNTHIGREVVRIGGWVEMTAGPVQDGQNIIYFLNDWEADRENEQARTTIYWSGDRIYEADIRINHKTFQFSAGDAPESGKVDFQSLLLHEFGHVLGLEHKPNPASVMAKSLPSATLRRSLSANDQDSVRCEY